MAPIIPLQSAFLRRPEWRADHPPRQNRGTCGEFVAEVGVRGWGFRVGGRVQGSGFLVQGSGFRGRGVQGLESRVQGFGSRVFTVQGSAQLVHLSKLAIDIQHVPVGTHRWPSSRYESAGLDGSLTIINSPSITDGRQSRIIVLIDSGRDAFR